MHRRQFRLKTNNLCNQFLVAHLLNNKRKCMQVGLQRKAIVYQTAIFSIKKYPLPIICGSQLKTLQGIGDMLTEELENVIKNHYKDFLRQTNDFKQTAKSHEKESQKQFQQCQQDQFSLSNSIRHHSLQVSKMKDSRQGQKDDKIEINSAIDKPYKPRPHTLASNIMNKLKQLSQGCPIDKLSFRQQIKIAFKQSYTAKTFQNQLDKLIKSGYINQLTESNQIQLTSKGQLMVLTLQGKQTLKESHTKIQSMLLSFKSNVIQQKSCRSQIKMKTMKQFAEKVMHGQLTLLIDTREIKNKNDLTYFEEKLTQKYHIQCKIVNLPIGDFVWTYNGLVLNYIIERKKADDLASSIYDGRYKQQKYRLGNCQIENIYYLYEGHLTATNNRCQRQVNSALLKTRIKDKFKIVQVANINESIKFVAFLHKQIFEDISNSNNIVTFGTLQQFTNLNNKCKQLTVSNIFGLSLKTIPRVGKNSVSEFLKYFSTFNSLRKELLKLQNRNEKINFLRELFKGCGMRVNVAQIIVDMLFSDKY